MGRAGVVLVVDDCAPVLRMLGRESARVWPDAEIVTAASVSTAMRELDDIDSLEGALIDLRLPDGCGTTIGERVIERFPQSPPLLMTNYALPGYLERAYALGAAFLSAKLCAAAQLFEYRAVVEHSRESGPPAAPLVVDHEPDALRGVAADELVRRLVSVREEAIDTLAGALASRSELWQAPPYLEDTFVDAFEHPEVADAAAARGITIDTCHQYRRRLVTAAGAAEGHQRLAGLLLTGAFAAIVSQCADAPPLVLSPEARRRKERIASQLWSNERLVQTVANAFERGQAAVERAAESDGRDPRRSGTFQRPVKAPLLEAHRRRAGSVPDVSGDDDADADGVTS